MKKLKNSFYNVLVPVSETNEYLIYNLVSGGLERLDWEEGTFLESLQLKGSSVQLFEGDPNQFNLESLRSKGFLVDEKLDEKGCYEDFYHRKKEILYDKEEASINLTVGTTIVCNMGCPYCFEFVKPNKSLTDEENLRAIIYYLQDMILKSPVKIWKSLNVTWYGGEPLINKNAIAKLTPMLKKLCQENNMAYSANIITNGILLTAANWSLLVDNDVSNVQITIDGPQQTHEKSRPLKGKKDKKNYFQILENLSEMPKNIKASIRINTDKEIAACIDDLLRDFDIFGLWPMKYDQITFKTAWLRTYEEAAEENIENRFEVDDFFDFQENFRWKLLTRYNHWAEKQNLPKAKLRWNLPEIQDECATWVSPYSLVVDADGNIHKCWETIHDDKEAISHVSQGYKLDLHRPYMKYDRTELNAECASCKFLPVCDKLSCSHQAIKDGKPECTSWKTKTGESLKQQYLLTVQHPDLISFPKHHSLENTGHSNK